MSIQSKSLIELIYGTSSGNMPILLQQRYSNRPYSKDLTTMNGTMDIYTSRLFRILSPLFRLVGVSIPFTANNMPVKVEIISDEASATILMKRTFNYLDKSPVYFSSGLLKYKSNVILELLRFRLATKLVYQYEKNKILMKDGGCVFRLGKWLIPIPLSIFVGKFSAFEEAISEDEFIMQVKMAHPWYGTLFQYDGKFRIIKSE